jgi:hypothetical protein
MDAYFSYAVTSLILFALVVFLRVTERKYPKIKYLSASSIMSFTLVLMLILAGCIPYPSKGWLDYLAGEIWFIIGYIPFLITLGIVSFLGVRVIFEDPMGQCFVFVVSFVLYTLLIFILIRIALYLKNMFGNKKPFATSDEAR